MITFVRTAGIHDGKLPEAFAWAVKVGGYVNKHIGGNIQVARNVGGPLYQVHWVGTYASLAEFEQLGKKLEADAGYQELLTQGRQQGLLIGSSIADHLYETIP